MAINWQMDVNAYCVATETENTLYEYSKVFVGLSPEEKKTAVGQIQSAISKQLFEKCCEGYPAFQKAIAHLIASYIVAAMRSEKIDMDMFKYIEQTMAYVVAWAEDCAGTQIHFLINNTCNNFGPVLTMRALAETAGMEFICPHVETWEMMKERGIDADRRWGLAGKLLAVARDTCTEKLKGCIEQGKSYLHWEIGGDPYCPSFKMTDQLANKDGHLVFFRSSSLVDPFGEMLIYASRRPSDRAQIMHDERFTKTLG